MLGILCGVIVVGVAVAFDANVPIFLN